MPYLAEISYSEKEFITALRDYYRFLTTLYLDGARVIIEPPEGGWPNITAETFGGPMGKSDGVVSLLRQLPTSVDRPVRRVRRSWRRRGAGWLTGTDYAASSRKVAPMPLTGRA